MGAVALDSSPWACSSDSAAKVPTYLVSTRDGVADRDFV